MTSLMHLIFALIRRRFPRLVLSRVTEYFLFSLLFKMPIVFPVRLQVRVMERPFPDTYVLWQYLADEASLFCSWLFSPSWCGIAVSTPFPSSVIEFDSCHCPSTFFPTQQRLGKLLAASSVSALQHLLVAHLPLKGSSLATFAPGAPQKSPGENMTRCCIHSALSGRALCVAEAAGRDWFLWPETFYMNKWPQTRYASLSRALPPSGKTRINGSQRVSSTDPQRYFNKTLRWCKA